MYCGGQQCIVLSRIQFIPAIVSNSYQNLLMKVVSNTLQPCVWHLACNIRTAHQIVFAQLSWFLVQPKTRWCPPYFPASNDLAGKRARAPRQPNCALVLSVNSMEVCSQAPLKALKDWLLHIIQAQFQVVVGVPLKQVQPFLDGHSEPKNECTIAALGLV